MPRKKNIVSQCILWAVSFSPRSSWFLVVWHKRKNYKKESYTHTHALLSHSHSQSEKSVWGKGWQQQEVLFHWIINYMSWLNKWKHRVEATCFEKEGNAKWRHSTKIATVKKIHTKLWYAKQIFLFFVFTWENTVKRHSYEKQVEKLFSFSSSLKNGSFLPRNKLRNVCK